MFERCPFCGCESTPPNLHCPLCGGRIEAITPREHLLDHLHLLRVLLRNRSWSRLMEAVRAVQKSLAADPRLTLQVGPMLGWLAQDLAQLLAPLHGAELVKIVTHSKHVLVLLPEQLAAPLQARCEVANTFLGTLAAREKQMKEKGAGPAEKIRGWLEPRGDAIGMTYTEVHACLYANPGRWPTLAGALDPPAFRTARLLAACNVGDKELREKNFGRAKKLFTDVLAKSPGYVRAWEGLALVEAALKNFPEAIRCLREAVRLGTLEARTFNNLAWYLATHGAPTASDLEEALVNAMRAVELAPCAGFYDTLAEVYWRRREWAAALANVRVACRLDPDRQDFRDRLLRIADEFQKISRKAAEIGAGDAEPFEEEALVAAEEDSSVAACEDDFACEIADEEFIAEAACDDEEEEIVQTTPPHPLTDQVHFTVTSQKKLQAGEPTLIDVWAHLDSQRQYVLARARQAQRDEEIAVRSHSGVAVVRDSSIIVQLRLPSCEVLEPESIIVWQGGIGNASFPVQVPENIRPGKHLGTVLFHVGGLLIAKLHFDVVVGGALTADRQLPAQTIRCRSAFASYSSKDRDEVIGRIQGMQKIVPNLDVFLDVAAMRSGENWEKRLHDEIKRRDVFYLFWSANACQSKEVDKEWRMALRERGPDYIDPVPLAPPDVVPPPRELADKHFNDWMLAYRRNHSLRP